MRSLAAFGVAFFISGCTVPNIQGPYYVTQVRDASFQVRSYGPRVVAETTVAGDWNDAGDEGFRRLAGYIFGKNRREAKTAMTAPVAQAPQKRQGIKLAMTAPVPQQRHGVRFSGRWTDANMKEHEATLLRWTNDQHLTVIGEAEVNRYDPPFKPWFLRRNEVWRALAADVKNERP